MKKFLSLLFSLREKKMKKTLEKTHREKRQ